MVMVCSNLPACMQRGGSNYDLETEYEIIWIELMRRNKPILFGVYYRPLNPSADLSQLCRSLSALPSTHHILLCGDFNAPSINWDTTSVIMSNSVASDLCDIVKDCFAATPDRTDETGQHLGPSAHKSPSKNYIR